MTKMMNEVKYSAVDHFISQIEDVKKKKDIYHLLKIFEEASGFEPVMWGPSMIGFGKYHYMIDKTFEGDAPLAAFAMKKTKINLYLAGMNYDKGKYLKQLGKYRRGKSCLYIKSMEDINEEALKELIIVSIQYLNSIYN